MAIRYKIDVLQALKENGYNSNRIRQEKIMGQATLQQLRKGELVSWKNIDTICELLQCNVGDLVEFINANGTTPEHFESKRAIKITRY